MLHVKSFTLVLCFSLALAARKWLLRMETCNENRACRSQKCVQVCDSSRHVCIEPNWFFERQGIEIPQCVNPGENAIDPHKPERRQIGETCATGIACKSGNCVPECSSLSSVWRCIHAESFFNNYEIESQKCFNPVLVDILLKFEAGRIQRKDVVEHFKTLQASNNDVSATEAEGYHASNEQTYPMLEDTHYANDAAISNSNKAQEISQEHLRKAVKVERSDEATERNSYNYFQVEVEENDNEFLIPNPKISGKGIPGQSKIINVGLPKCGSSSIGAFFYFALGEKSTSHYICAKEGQQICGICIENAIRKGLPPLSTCGNFTVYAQMDVSLPPNSCTFPQISYFKNIYLEDNTATFILPFRNITSWIHSISNWQAGELGYLRPRLVECDLPNLPKGVGAKDKEMKDFVVNHVREIRQFVQDHPSLSLVEFSIEDPSAGEYLASVFPDERIVAENWGHYNKNKNISELFFV